MTVCVESPGASILQGAGKEINGTLVSRPFDPIQYFIVSKLLDEVEPTTIELLSGLVKIRALQDTIITIVGEASAQIDGRKAAVNMVFILFKGKTLQVMGTSSAPVYIGFSKLKLSRNRLTELRKTAMTPLLPGEILDCEPVNRARVHLVGRFLKEGTKQPTTTLRYLPELHFSNSPVLCSPWKPLRVNRYLIAFEGPKSISVPPTLKKEPKNSQFGTIHISPDGKPLIAGPEVGKAAKAYTMVGKVIEADLPYLSRLTKSDEITFTPVTADLAEDVLKKQHMLLSTIVVDPQHVGSW